MDSYIVSARKYRPDSFSMVVGQSSITTTLKNAIQRQQLAHAYLFCGPRGVGKTTCARIFAKTINCEHPTADMEACNQCVSCESFNSSRSFNIHELDAASNNSVDNIRALIEQVRIPPQIGKYSVYIIDEVHMLSPSAFNAFLKTLEEPPAHAIFILATTEKHKILPTILSRCQIFDFNRITLDDTIAHLKDIAAKESVQCEDDALAVIAQKADGAMRDALSIFDQLVSFCGTQITYAQVVKTLNVLDYDYYFQLTDCILKQTAGKAFLLLEEIISKGFDPQHLLSGLNSHFRNLLMCKNPATVPLLEVGANIAQRYKEQSANCSVTMLYQSLKLCNQFDLSFKSSNNYRLHVEIALLQLCYQGDEKKNSSPNPANPTNSDNSATLKPASAAVPASPVEPVAPAAPVAQATPVPQVATEAGKTQQVEPIPTEQPVVPTEQAKPAQPVEPIPPIPASAHNTDNPASKATVPGQIATNSAGQPRISIKNALKGIANENRNHALSEEKMHEPFTLEQAQKYWNTYAKMISRDQIRLSHTLCDQSLMLEENSKLQFAVMNEDQKKEVTEELPRIMSFLKTQLRNTDIRMEIILRKPEKQDLIYHPNERFELFKEMSEPFSELAQELDLQVHI